ncbi:MAG TPA: PfkB family carbohydrate kinase [Polyangiaceae bacterium]|nr:PfkB family carbohydrate kinase [Polyangiaceae bacterium]
MPGLNIRATGALDFLALGALVHRLDPGVIPFRKATECQLHVSGGEFNVAANLADAFAMNAGVVSAMVDYPIGDLVSERVRAMGVKPYYRRFEHDGVNGPNIATVYSDRGHGVRAPVVFYNRANEAAAKLRPGDVDWSGIFAGGVRWFHSGGIFASLSETTGELIIEGMKAAHQAGAITSFDLNFREKLWSVWGGKHKAFEVLARIVEHVDVLLGGVELLLDPDGASRDASADAKLDHASALALIERAVAKHPHVKAVATTLREVHSTSRHDWSAVAWIDGKTYQAPTCQLDVLDRVGGGDGFAAGFVYGLLNGDSPQLAVNLGWAHGALLTTFPGDTTMATAAQVRALASGGSAQIQR